MKQNSDGTWTVTNEELEALGVGYSLYVTPGGEIGVRGECGRANGKIVSGPFEMWEAILKDATKNLKKIHSFGVRSKDNPKGYVPLAVLRVNRNKKWQADQDAAAGQAQS